MTPSHTVVYTDGSSVGALGPGGWAWAVEVGPQASGGAHETTNQRMEVTAGLEAVRALTGPLVVVSDSAYLVNCFKQRWYRKWHRNGWRNTAGKPVVNRDLWEQIVPLVLDRGDVTFQWVKGHSGHVMNDHVDRLANAARLALAPGVVRQQAVWPATYAQHCWSCGALIDLGEPISRWGDGADAWYGCTECVRAMG